ncbi:carbonic anhydrase 12 [Astyanax mexicanus]|uniref:Carbonic anhydrase n=2 Tax=Astyanax mexicanus TaxID=7994 RepID=A0A8B9KEK1_ASTMX|nr:carbonic anhydrase 12 [Astyanax mexicanus]KAG9281017.1 carbonic anhydrase 12 isoform X1 [Astyanax mexicanus]
MMPFTLLIMILIAFPVSSNGGKWGYNGPNGEHHWPKHFPYCGGAFQSPVNFQPELLRYDPNLFAIQLQNYNLSSREQLTLSNNGHSVQLSLPSYMQLTGLPHRYSAAQLHFHWGTQNVQAGSEHTVNGKQFAAEMHVVHFNSGKYPNISMAVDKSDGLAVLGVFIEVGEFNPAFEKFFKYVNGIKYRDQKVQVPAFNIRELLPSRLDEYYRYDGSLTTPPCFPSVLWTVFRQPVTISLRQYLALATALYSSHAQEVAPMPMLGNYRKPQLMDNRVVLVSFQDGWALRGTLSVASPTQRRQVIQQLLQGDLADLADEKLHQLLPKIKRKPWAPKEWKNDLIHQQSQKQRNKVPGPNGKNLPVLKNTDPSLSLAKLGINEDALCFISMEKNVSFQLLRRHANEEMVHALKRVVFPELNLRSYLKCKSDLDLQTIRCLLRTRPTDEAAELEQSLTKATRTDRQQTMPLPRSMTPNRGSALTKLAGQTPITALKNAHNMFPPFYRQIPVEYED